MAVNLTVGPPTRRIVAFTIPLLIGNLFQQLYAFTDAAVVGRLLGVKALAAVGATGSLQFLLIGFTFGAAGGLAIPVARAFGAREYTQMRRYVAAGVLVSAGITVVITLIGTLGARFLLTLLNTPAEIIADSERFLAILFAGTATAMAYNFLASVIRALGDSRTPLYFLVVSSLLNGVLVFWFVGALGWGIGGAAAATVTAQTVSVILCLVLIARRMPQLRLTRADWGFPRRDLAESARMGLTMGLQLSVIAIGTLILQHAINGLGADAVAGFAAAIRVDQMAVAPLGSFGLAIATYVAQNRGARHWHRIRVGVFRTGFVMAGVAVLVGGLIFAFGTSIVGLFLGPGQPVVTGMAHQYLVINSSLYALLALLFLFRNSIQALGHTAVPTLAGVMELVVRALAGLFLVDRLGFLGACIASPAAWVGAGVPVAIAWIGERRRLKRTEAGDARVRAEHGVADEVTDTVR